MQENSPSSEHPLKVMIVDDHPPMRMGLIALINSHPHMTVIAEAADGEEAFEVYEDVLPDIVLMDLRMPGMGGAEATLRIRKRHPGAKIVVISTYDWDEDIHRALESGASSYILKDMPIEDIAETVEAVYKGEATLPSTVTKRLAERARRAPITERERDVLEALVKGRSNKEIARDLSISDETVKSHFKTLFAKLHVRDRTEAAIAAIRHGIIHIDE
ncbi:response regulator [Pelagicoccus mobilis]|uniref:Response regulator transcription factor n=1 Tax=Pelagicoccus mobilis TaxID=415221 RepID=A0A934VK00_9BACT|nr:response regulator transcription factor [Pelagicoccus mobilis]MBK1876141.1 response regulator transcription factor [Pelagicoccus mobilis]